MQRLTVCVVQGCARLDWSVLKVSLVELLCAARRAQLCSQWNQPSIDFYEKSLGASAMSEWMGMRLEGEGIANLKKFTLQ